MRALAPRQRELNLRLAVNQTVVDAEGARQYRQLRDRLRPLGVRNQVVIAYQASATYSLRREVDVAPRAPGSFVTFGDLEPADADHAVRRDRARIWPSTRCPSGWPSATTWTASAAGCWRAAPTPTRPAWRWAPTFACSPTATSPPASSTPTGSATCAARASQELWRGEEVDRQRAWVRNCPGCWAECEVLPNAIYSGDLLRVVRAARR